jgi:iron complex transport system ATP-binding protein
VANVSIEINNLSIGYRQKQVVAENLSATLHYGELTCLIGPNGVGKSTLMRTLAAFQPPLAGEIWINRKHIDTFSDQERSQTIGIVLTDRVEVHHLTVRELVGMGRSPYTGFWGALRDEDESILQDSLQQTGISHLEHRLLETLSDGERQKVMIAKTLTQQTPILFLDEPTAFLDFPGKAEILQTLLRLSRTKQKTILLSTHDLDLALQVADTLWVMDKANGLVTGSPQQLIQLGYMEKLFPSKNLTFDIQSRRFKINEFR